VYNAHGRIQEASYFADKAQKDGLMYVGPTWKYLEETQTLIDSPQKHDSYLNIVIEDEF
jgi:pyruvate carboxylase